MRVVHSHVKGAEQRAAIERGRAVLREWQQLLETGTDLQIEAEELWRGVMIRADILAFRAVARACGQTDVNA